MPLSKKKKRREKVRVSGHEKTQRCGPGGTQRKRIFVKTYERKQDVNYWFSKLDFSERVIAFVVWHNPDLGEQEKLALVRALAKECKSSDPPTVEKAVEWLHKLAS